MEYLPIGKTELNVSRICLGTMTWGEQNSEKEAFEQLDYALERGVNFIDTAELYSVPARPETYGITEKYIGNWIKQRNNRDKFYLATKISGPGPKHIRGGSKFNREHLTKAVEGSLKRLNTEVIDLYQLHWPERKTNYFGRLGYVHSEDKAWDNNIPEILNIFQDLINEGKIRYIGLSNETPWGAMRFISEAEKNNLPRIVSIQNPYSLLNRTYEVGLAEISHREDIGLLAYSPLAFGMLSGKYYQGKKPKNARLTLFGDKLPRYNGMLSHKAADKYTELAIEVGLSPAQMALAYVNSRSFLASNIIGATSMEQLKENIESVEIKLPENVLKAIDTIHNIIPNPAP